MTCSDEGTEPVQGSVATAGRKRAAVELIGRQDAELRHTARRYSLCEDDAEDAYQRALEILLVKAPTDRPRELIRWMKTVVKHEALAMRRNRERLLGVGEDGKDPIAQIAATSAGPGERLERRALGARSREGLRGAKPAELRGWCSVRDRGTEFLVGLHSRLPGAGGASDGGIAQVAATGGTRGVGVAALAKALAICAGTVGGAAACVATGVVPAPLGLEPQHAAQARIERISERAGEEAAPPVVDYEPDAPPSEPQPQSAQQQKQPEPPEPAPEPAEAGAVEYTPPPPEPVSTPAAAEPSTVTSGSAAGEFGP